MKLLVTGASGNIGTVLKSKLQENDIPFIGVDITNQNSSNNNFFQLDITNENELQEKKSVFDNIDTLIHLASKIDTGSDVTNKGIQSIDVNIKGTLNLLEHLPSLKNILKNSKKIKILFEFMPENTMEVGFTPIELLNYLTSNDFKLYCMDNKTKKLLYVSNNEEIIKLCSSTNNTISRNLFCEK